MGCSTWDQVRPEHPVSNFITWPPPVQHSKVPSSFQVYSLLAILTVPENQQVSLAFSIQLYYLNTAFLSARDELNPTLRNDQSGLLNHSTCPSRKL